MSLICHLWCIIRLWKKHEVDLSMTLLNQPIQVYGKIPELFSKIKEGQAPEKFTREHLKDIGFRSSNHHALIPLLKGLGFLTADGTPTDRYKDYLDNTKSERVMAEAIKESYSDIFTIKSKPSKSDKDVIAGKYRSAFNLSEDRASRAAHTFLKLLDLSDKAILYGEANAEVTESATAAHEEPNQPLPDTPSMQTTEGLPFQDTKNASTALGLHYNIQIHLPPTKDIEVYNAIFKSLKEHILDNG